METTGDIEMPVKPIGRTVLKRDGSKAPFDKEKITQRVKSLAYGLSEKHITVDEIVEKVANGLYDGKLILR